MPLEKRSDNFPKENLVIVGSGPAGYTAAIYAARANLKPLLITGFQKGGIPGGQLMTTTHVENFPGFPNGVLGPELMDLMKAQAIRWGAELIEEDAIEIKLKNHPFLIKTTERIIRSSALIIATGAKANKLGLPNEDEFWSKGISACAICDGATPQFKEEELAVVGGGDSACEEAVYLTKYGSHVHLLVRGEKLRANASMANRVLANPLITVHWETEVLKVNGKDWIESIKVISKTNNIEKEIPIKGLFYAIGHTPNSELIANQIETNAKGYIVTLEGRPETSLEGVFTAGDISDPEWKQAITAASSGCKAALSAERWLSKKGLTQLIKPNELEPKKSEKLIPTEVSSKENFKENAIWQKGSYALRKLYHSSDKPLIVIYTSANCGPCYILKPKLKKLLHEFAGKAQGVEIDIEKDYEIARQAGINGTPTIQLFLNKELLNQWKGVKQKSVFKEAINQLI